LHLLCGVFGERELENLNIIILNESWFNFGGLNKLQRKKQDEKLYTFKENFKREGFFASHIVFYLRGDVKKSGWQVPSSKQTKIGIFTTTA